MAKPSIKYYSRAEFNAQVDPYNVVPSWYKRTTSDLNRFERCSPLWNANPKAIFNDYLERIDAVTRHNYAIDFNLDQLKHFGRQGGKPALKDLKAVLRKYYEFADYDVQDSETLTIGLCAFRQLVRFLLRTEGVPVIYPEKMILTPKSSGLPMMRKKELLSVHLLRRANTWTHPQRIVAGNRRMRNRLRAVFNASAEDIDFLTSILTPVRNWFKKVLPRLFSSYRNPVEHLYPMISDDIRHRRWILTTDYDSCDMHLIWEVVRRYVLPIYEDILPPAVYLQFHAFVEESYRSELVFPDEVWSGLHATFSGLEYVTDFETLYDIVLNLGACLVNGMSVEEFINHFTALGDDTYLSFKTKEQAEAVYSTLLTVTKQVGTVYSEAKTRLERGRCEYLRCAHYESAPKGGFSADEEMEFKYPYYPSVLALNNSLQPERLHSNPKLELLAVLARNDNLQHNFDYVNYSQWLFSHLKPMDLAFGKSDEELFLQIQQEDWWYRNGNPISTLKQSPTFRILQNQKRVTLEN